MCKLVDDMFLERLLFLLPILSIIYCFLFLAAVPRGGPHIQGYDTEVSLGDELQLNCTSLKSKPAASLQFFINNKVSHITSDRTQRFRIQRLCLGCEIEACELTQPMTFHLIADQ